jgi:putative glutamine amidotransferase
MKNQPIIGIILDWENDGTFSQFPYFALREHYINAINLAGGVPFLIPYSSEDLISIYLDKIDGLLVPGGFYASPSDWYIDPNISSPYQKTPRIDFELKMIKEALDQNKPMLCICAGMQVLAGLLGCKLIPNIDKYIENNIEHFDLSKNHDINIEKDSLLHKITGKNIINVNSHHKEAIFSVNNNIKISARSSDDVIEAIEIIDKKFVIGLQYHPEMMCYKKEQLQDFNPHHLIFKEFINSSRKN